MSENIIFAVLPYLKTTNDITIYGIKFKSSEEVSNLPNKAQKHFKNIFSLFYLKDDYQIKNMTYTYFEVKDSKKEEKMVRLFKAQTLLAFFYSAPHPIFLDTFLTKEHANLFLFSPKEFLASYIQPPQEVIVNKNLREDDEKVSGYKVKINNNKSFFRVTKDSKIYPPQGNFILNISQDIYKDLKDNFPKQSPFSKLIHGEEINPEIESKIFTALKWYNRSVSLGISDETALVNLAIAFESLLDLEQDNKIIKRFKESVGLLVGSVPKLDDWLVQFYNARSKIVHEGKSDDLMFESGDSKYRSLVSYGRRVFQVCLGTIVYGTNLSLEMSLPYLLETNSERFEKICRTLQEDNLDNPKKAIISLRKDINNIEKYKFIGEDNLKLRVMLSSLKRMFKFYLETNPNIDQDIVNKMRKFVTNYNEYDDFAKLSLLKEIIDYIDNEELDKTSREEVFMLVHTLIKGVWSHSFNLYYYLKRKRKENN